MARDLQLVVVEIRQRNAQLVPYLGLLNWARSPRGLSLLHHDAIHIRLLGRGNEIVLGKLANPSGTALVKAPPS
jgi:hypothetical protein